MELTRSLDAYQSAPTEDHHLLLLETISTSLDTYLRIQEQTAREQQVQARQSHRSAVVAQRIATASMIFGAAGWIVALIQLLLSL